MKNYESMSCGELRREIEKIDKALRSPQFSFNKVEKDKLMTARRKINGILLHKIEAILYECDEEE